MTISSKPKRFENHEKDKEDKKFQSHQAMTNWISGQGNGKDESNGPKYDYCQQKLRLREHLTISQDKLTTWVLIDHNHLDDFQTPKLDD